MGKAVEVGQKTDKGIKNSTRGFYLGEKSGGLCYKNQSLLLLTEQGSYTEERGRG